MPLGVGRADHASHNAQPAGAGIRRARWQVIAREVIAFGRNQRVA